MALTTKQMRRFGIMPVCFTSPKLVEKLKETITFPEIRSGGGQNGVVAISAGFLTNEEQLQEFLPDGMKIAGEPVVNVSFVVLESQDWLGGHGYNLITVGFQASFDGKEDHVVGTYLPVIWENMCEPILTGREFLGWSKIYADIPEPEINESSARGTAEWKGFEFLTIEVADLKSMDPAQIPKNGKPSAGTMHLRYFPKPGVPGEADVECVTLCEPAPDQPGKLESLSVGKGSIKFHAAAEWKQLPTMVHIVNALADLEVKEYRGGSVSRSSGGGPGIPRVLR